MWRSQETPVRTRRVCLGYFLLYAAKERHEEMAMQLLDQGALSDGHDVQDLAVYPSIGNNGRSMLYQQSI